MVEASRLSAPGHQGRQGGEYLVEVVRSRLVQRHLAVALQCTLDDAAPATPELGAAYYEYDVDSRLVRKVLGNDCHTYFSYDQAGRLSQLLNCLPDGSPLAYFEYTYDAASRITALRREDGNVIYYGYDQAERLTGEHWYDSTMTPLYAFQWDYDPVGNRTCERRDGTETHYEYDAGDRLTPSVTEGEYTYFAYNSHGDCVSIHEPGGTTYFAYGPTGMVRAIAYPGGTATYFSHDGMSGMYALEDSAGLRYFAWDPARPALLAERDGTGAVTAEYVNGHAPTEGIGTVAGTRVVDGGAPYYRYPAFDHRGTVVRVTDEHGNVTGRFEYDAWGVPLQGEETGTAGRFGYQSNWLRLGDSDGKLLLSRARLYAPALGRFLQVDPLGLERNGYGYLLARPTRETDPYGLTPSVSGDLAGLICNDVKGWQIEAYTAWIGPLLNETKDAIAKVRSIADALPPLVAEPALRALDWIEIPVAIAPERSAYTIRRCPACHPGASGWGAVAIGAGWDRAGEKDVLTAFLG